jgi:hypothetical protein
MGTASYTETLSDLNIATADYYEDVVSQVNYDNFISSRLLKKSRPATGKFISVPLEYGEENVQTMSRYEEYNLNPEELLDKAMYLWRHVNGTMVLDEQTMEVENVGKEEIINIAETKSKNLARTLRKKFSQLLFTSVANLTSKDPDSLIKIVATASNSVGGIDGASYTGSPLFDWNPKILDYSSNNVTYPNLTTPGGTYYVEKLFRKLHSLLTIDTDHPTVFLVTQGIWDAYEEVLRADKRYEGKEMTADGGFLTLKFRNTLIAVDNNVPGGKLNTVSNYGAMILALNEDYLGYRHSKNVNFRLTEWKKSERQPVFFALYDWYGAFICSRRDRQGAILGMPTDAQVYV